MKKKIIRHYIYSGNELISLQKFNNNNVTPKPFTFVKFKWIEKGSRITYLNSVFIFMDHF